LSGDGEFVEKRGGRRWDPEGVTGEEGKPIGCGLHDHNTVGMVLQQLHPFHLPPLRFHGFRRSVAVAHNQDLRGLGMTKQRLGLGDEPGHHINSFQWNKTRCTSPFQHTKQYHYINSFSL